QPIVDRLHHPSAEPGQTGRDGTGVSGFFSMEKDQLPVPNLPKRNLCLHKIKNPVQIGIWTGFYTL
ncbi:hypothetical protein C8N25_105222, partial [Algoriphagus antarcticus]